MTKTRPRRVADGARYLDETQPGWHTRIDWGTYSFSHDNKCTLGQVMGMGTWSKNKDAAFPDITNYHEKERLSQELGFAALDTEQLGLVAERYQELWRREVNERLHKTPVADPPIEVELTDDEKKALKALIDEQRKRLRRVQDHAPNDGWISDMLDEQSGILARLATKLGV